MIFRLPGSAQHESRLTSLLREVCSDMLSTVSDPDVLALASIAATLQAEYAGEEILWAGSPFAWIKTRPSRQVGTIGERLVAGWLAAKDFDVTKSPDSDAARPMVFATTLLLIVLVVVLNLGAILLRNHLRNKYKTGAF